MIFLLNSDSLAYLNHYWILSLSKIQKQDM